VTFAALVKTNDIRVWDMSAGGCLLESRTLLPIGTVGLLVIDLDGHRRREWFRICRVHAEEGRRGTCLLGAEFLPLAPAGHDSLRRAARDVREQTQPGNHQDALTIVWGSRELRGQSSPIDSPATSSLAVFGSTSPTSDEIAAHNDSGNGVAPLVDTGAPRREAGEGVSPMMQFVSRFVRNDEGQDLIEYVLIGTLVSIAVIAGAGLLGTNLNGWYNKLATWVSTQSAKVP